MAVNGARVSSLNRTARSAIDTANLKIGGCQSFPNVHSLFQYNYRLTAITRDQRERGLRSREPSRDSPTRTGPDSGVHTGYREPKILKCLERYLTSVPVDLWLWPHLTLCDPLPDFTDSCDPQLVPKINSSPSQRSVRVALSIGGTLQTFKSGDWNFWTWFLAELISG